MFEPKEVRPIFEGTQRIFEFPNGFGASVVCHDFSYGGRKGLFELAVLDKNGHITYDTPITRDVLGHLTEEEVQETLEKIAQLGKEG